MNEASAQTFDFCNLSTDQKDILRNWLSGKISSEQAKEHEVFIAAFRDYLIELLVSKTIIKLQNRQLGLE